MKKSIKFQASLAVMVCSGLLAILGVNIMLDKKNKIDAIEVYHPFTFSRELNPKRVMTVGDQVLSEHLFAFHIRQSIKSGTGPVMSDFSIDEKKNTIIIRPKYKMRLSDGSYLPLKKNCEDLLKSLTQTLHMPYAKRIRDSQCFSDRIEIHLKAIPINLRYLFTLPDFAIIDPSKVPLKKMVGEQITTGPYSLESYNDEKAILKLNPFYPEKLRANTIDKVVVHKYSSSNITHFISKLTIKKQHLLYFSGQSIQNEDIRVLKEKKYNIEKYPNEWLVYLKMKDSIPLEDRVTIGRVIDAKREEILKTSELGTMAYSIPPINRSFGLKKDEYIKALEGAHNTYKQKKKLTKKIEIAASEFSYQFPITKKTIDLLLQEFPEQITLKLYSSRDSMVGLGDKVDILISSLGISHFDPLSHMSFLKNAFSSFEKIISDEELSNLSIENDWGKFDEGVKAIDKRVAAQRILIPLAHFPGIIASSPHLVKDESLSFSWGIQAWTYRIR